jgi:hypothetical protein
MYITCALTHIPISLRAHDDDTYEIRCDSLAILGLLPVRTLVGSYASL